MEEILSNDRQISYHRNKKDYVPSPVDSLQLAFGDRRYKKMTKELNNGTDIIRVSYIIFNRRSKF